MRAIVLGLCLCLLFLVSEAHAAVRNRAVVLESAAAVDPELEQTLAELFRRNDIVLIRADESRHTPDADVVARVQIDSTDSGAVVTVRGVKNSGSVVHREVTRAASAALFRETVAHVIVAAVDPLLVAPGDAKPPQTTPTPEAKEEVKRESAEKETPTDPDNVSKASFSDSSLAFSIGAHAGALLVSSRDRSGSLHGSLSISSPRGIRPAAIAEAGYVFPIHAVDRGLDARVGLIPLRLRGRLEPLASSVFGFGASVDTGIDILSFSSVARERLIRPESETSRLQPVVGGALFGRARIATNLSLVLSLGVDFDLTPRRWVIASPNESPTVFETARFRPYGMLGFEWALLGGTPPSPPVLRHGGAQ